MTYVSIFQHFRHISIDSLYLYVLFVAFIYNEWYNKKREVSR